VLPAGLRHDIVGALCWCCDDGLEEGDAKVAWGGSWTLEDRS
jgi:hypothetical protein